MLERLCTTPVKWEVVELNGQGTKQCEYQTSRTAQTDRRMDGGLEIDDLGESIKCVGRDVKS
jgi:hypothetical protein